nr:hypothetical protein [Tanacetum cinerariifolium]
PNFACCGGFVESGLQERYGLTEMEEGVEGKGVQALGGKIGKQCTVHSVFEHGGDRDMQTTNTRSGRLAVRYIRDPTILR